MSSFRTIVLSAVVILLHCSGSAVAQTAAATTLNEQSASRALVRAARGVSGFAWKGPEPCSDQLFTRPAPWVLLTTAECLDRRDPRDLWIGGPGAGKVAYLFAPAGSNSLVPADRALRHVGIVDTENLNAMSLKLALVNLGFNIGEVSGYRDFTALSTALNNGQIHAIAVLDDGIGGSYESFLRMQDDRNRVGDAELLPAAWIESRQLKWSANPQLFAGVVNTHAFAQDEGLNLPEKATTKAVALRLLNVLRRPEMPKPKPPGLFARLTGWTYSVIAAPDHGPKALDVELPVLVVRGSPPNLSNLVDAIVQASLTAAVDALINPCLHGADENYYAFVRAAAANKANEPARMAPLWEHYELHRGRKAPNATFRMQASRVGNAEGVKKRSQLQSDLRTALEQMNVAQGAPRNWHECPSDDKERGSPALKYYRTGVARLRQALESGATGLPMRQAAACLLKSVEWMHNPTPTCYETSTGMFTDPYAPYAAIAVLLRNR